MSAGVCGKRVGFEELFGSSSPPSKRSRCSGFGSPTRSSDLGSGSDDTLFTLLQMFPSLDPQLVRTAHRNYHDKIDDAIDSLKNVSFGDVAERNKLENFEFATIRNCDAAPAPTATTSFSGIQVTEQEGEHTKAGEFENTVDGSKWVDLFVQEMMNAADLDDARMRTARILEAFEKSLTAHSRASEQVELASLKEHLQSLLNDNQILKRAVYIQHERNLEQEEKTKEVQNLKVLLNQYHEQIRSLELNNYALELHLQRAQQNITFHGHFNRDLC